MEEFEISNFFIGKMKAKGKPAVVLGYAGAAFLLFGGAYLLTKNQDVLEQAKEYAAKFLAEKNDN